MLVGASTTRRASKDIWAKEGITISLRTFPMYVVIPYFIIQSKHTASSWNTLRRKNLLTT